MKNLNIKITAIIICTVFLSISNISISQNVGINQLNPHASAILDITATDMGLLIPRVDLDNISTAAPVTAPAEGLLIYNETGTEAHGFYYWNGSQWVKLLSGAGGEWTDAGTYVHPNENTDIRVYEDNATYGFYYDGAAANGVDATGTVVGVIGTVGTQYGYLGSSNVGAFGYSNDATGAGVFGDGDITTTGVYGTTTAATESGIYGYVSLSDGFGVRGYNANATGTGIIGTGNGITGAYLTGGSGLSGSSSNVGVYGKGDATATSYGVYGISDATDGVGVYGRADAATGFGTYGYNANASGTGIIGVGNNIGGSYLTGGTGGAFTGEDGLYAKGANATDGTGVVGTGNNSASIYTLTSGSGGAFTALDIGVYGVGTSTTSAGGYFEGGSDYAYVSIWSGGTSYKINGSGVVATIVEDISGNKVNMFCPEAPEITFQDYGTDKLINGSAHINIDPTLSKNIYVDKKYPLKVFIQLEGNCNGVYVTNKSANGFDVVELNGGTSNVSFSWLLIANRANEIKTDKNGNQKTSKNVGVRFPDSPKPMNKKLTKEKQLGKNKNITEKEILNIKKNNKL